MCSKPNLDIVFINVIYNLIKRLSICSQDIKLNEITMEWRTNGWTERQTSQIKYAPPFQRGPIIKIKGIQGM